MSSRRQKNTPRVVTRVVTRDTLLEQMKSLANVVLQPWLKENDLNFASAILVSMQIVEKFSEEQGKLAGSDKLNAAIALIPAVVDLAVTYGKITPQDADTLRSRLQTGGDIVKQIIAAYVIISKHPAFIQAQEAVEEAAKKCWGSCKTKCMGVHTNVEPPVTVVESSGDVVTAADPVSTMASDVEVVNTGDANGESMVDALHMSRDL